MNQLIDLYRLELSKLNNFRKRTILIHEEGLKPLLDSLGLDWYDVSIEQLDCGILKVEFYY